MYYLFINPKWIDDHFPYNKWDLVAVYNNEFFFNTYYVYVHNHQPFDIILDNQL